MNETEMFRVLEAFPDFQLAAESKADGLIGGWEGYDQYGYKKGRWTVFDDEDLNFKISSKTPEEFMEYLRNEADGEYICIDNMHIKDYIKNVRKSTPISVRNQNKRLDVDFTEITIPGDEIEDYILDNDELPGIDPYTFLRYDHSVDYTVILYRYNNVVRLQLIYPMK